VGVPEKRGKEMNRAAQKERLLGGEKKKSRGRKETHLGPEGKRFGRKRPPLEKKPDGQTGIS